VTAFDRMREELLAFPPASGMAPSTLLRLSEPLRGALRQVMRRGSATLDELSGLLGLADAETCAIADLMVACGFLTPSEPAADGTPVYRIHHAKRARPTSSAAPWNVLLDDQEHGGEEGG
jgi:hypothetical protein